VLRTALIRRRLHTDSPTHVCRLVRYEETRTVPCGAKFRTFRCWWESPCIWNNLPDDFVSAELLSFFHRLLKRFFFLHHFLVILCFFLMRHFSGFEDSICHLSHSKYLSCRSIIFLRRGHAGKGSFLLSLLSFSFVLIYPFALSPALPVSFLFHSLYIYPALPFSFPLRSGPQSS